MGNVEDRLRMKKIAGNSICRLKSDVYKKGVRWLGFQPIVLSYPSVMNEL